jgi:hypothetical protein
MLQVYRANEGYDVSGGGFVEAAFFKDKPVGDLCKVQGGVHGFDFSFDEREIGIGGNVVD